jgi:hypothetical protein
MQYDTITMNEYHTHICVHILVDGLNLPIENFRIQGYYVDENNKANYVESDCSYNKVDFHLYCFVLKLK